MPVLMNKGDDPRRAAWLFYTDRAELDEWGRQIVEGRWDSARLVVDPESLEAAKKASSPVEVWAQAKTLIPEDFDLEAARGEVMEATQAAIERAKMEAEAQAEEGASDAEHVPADGDGAEGAPAGSEGEAEAASDAPESEQDAQAGSETTPDALEGKQDAQEGDENPFDYEPIPAPEGLRIHVGTTTRQAALSYLMAHENEEGEGDEEAAADTDLPGLQMLAQLIDYMRDSADGLPSFAVWHIDPSGILRMVRAKKVKAMAGNVLSVKN